jgi:hypothetical protein
VSILGNPPPGQSSVEDRLSRLESRPKIPRIRDEDPKLLGSFQLDPVR